MGLTDETLLPRELQEKREDVLLSPEAAHSSRSRGRIIIEEECDIRTAFQRDIDRITHCKSFRRLIHKTQVFLRPEGDHYRTRLTHTLEVSRIARTIARAIFVNEDLTEAIALGHDLGHTPFGHAGERALDDIMHKFGGFRHNEQSLRVVDKIEKGGKGLNLTFETRDGISNHPRGYSAGTVEGRIVQLSDRLAYVNHDSDDAVRAGIFTFDDIPEEIRCVLGETTSERINTLVKGVIEEYFSTGNVAYSAHHAIAFNSFYSFLQENLYQNPVAKSEETKVFGILKSLFDYYSIRSDILPVEYQKIAETDGVDRAVCDYISGMTDGYAIRTYNELFVPDAWRV